MIKAKTNNGDLLLGLSKENIKRLQEDQPIAFNLNKLFPGMPGKVIIVYGETETEIMKRLKIGPDTKIKT